MPTTDAWVLRRGSRQNRDPGELERCVVPLPEMGNHEVLAEPVFGCWEANMTHALQRKPVDICRLRREPFVILGNAGVVRIVKTGPAVSVCEPGNLCSTVPIGRTDALGHPMGVLGYDEPHTMGMLAKQMVLKENQVAPLPQATRHSYQQWAGFPVRYATAWDNWHLAYNVWKLQMGQQNGRKPHVWAWGGGVSLAEVQLARYHGCPAAMIASTDYRLNLLQGAGITAIDRRGFFGLAYDQQRYQSDRAYKAKYLQSEKVLLEQVRQHTDGSGVSIFIDNIGYPVQLATLRALGRMGVVTTCGWKLGKRMSFDRAGACVARHVFVHTHGCRRSEGLAAEAFAEEHGWLPPPGAEVYAWEDVPQLAADYAAGRTRSYFPLYQVNPL